MHNLTIADPEKQIEHMHSKACTTVSFERVVHTDICSWISHTILSCREQNYTTKYSNILRALFRKVWDEAEVPTDWKERYLINIPKKKITVKMLELQRNNTTISTGKRQQSFTESDVKLLDQQAELL